MNGGAIHLRAVASNVEIINCVFYGNTADQGSSISSEADLYVESCLMIQNSANDKGSIYLTAVDDLTCYNSTFYADEVGSGSGQKIIDGDGTSSVFDVQNTIIWGCDQDPGDLIHAGSVSSTINQCILQGPQSNGTNIITDDPLFADAPGLDLQLTAASPGMNTGVSGLVTSSNDAFLEQRVQLGNVDIGALEFNGAMDNVIFVDLNATGNGSGSSWANAQTNLENAIEEAASVGNEIWVAEGTYYPSTTSTRTGMIELVDQLKLYGGFSGIETSAAQREPWNYKTLLSGNIGDLNTNTDNSYRIMYGENLTDIVIDGFCFRDAYRAWDANFDRGELYFDNCEATVLKCEFTQNSAYANVGIQCTNSSLYLENSLFHNNFSGPGGIVSGLFGCTLEIVGCTFAENQIATGNTVIGALNSSTLLLSNNIISQPGCRTVADLGNITAYNCILSDGETNLVPFDNIRSEDPLFVDPDNEDFTITSSSNAYDSGDPSYSTQSKRLGGNNRVTDTEIDRGCFESLVCEQINDLCANAIELQIDATATFGSNRCATNTPDETTSCFINDGLSVWHSFEAPASERAEVISTWVSKFTSIFNTRHVVLEGTCGNFNVLACDNENTGGQGENTLFTDLSPGETYYVRFDGFSNQEGRFTIRVEEPEIPVVPDVTYVDLDAAGNNDGTSWENAFVDLQDGISAVSSGDIIWVAEGTYYPTSGTDQTIVFEMPDGVHIYGGFQGNETAFDQRIPNQNKTILSADIGIPDDVSDNSEFVLLLGLGDTGISCDRLTLTGTGLDAGQVLRVRNNNAVLSNLEITGNISNT